MVEPPDSRRPVVATELQRSPADTKTFRAGRVCAEPDCTTVLSIYNGSYYCSVHRPHA